MNSKFELLFEKSKVFGNAKVDDEINVQQSMDIVNKTRITKTVESKKEIDTTEPPAGEVKKEQKN